MPRPIITDLEPLSTKFARATLVLLALILFGSAQSTTELPYLDAPGWWATLFLGAGLLSLAAAVTMRRELVILAGSATLAAFAMRAGVVVVAYLGDKPAAQRFLTAGGVRQAVLTWSSQFIAWGIIFLRGLVPLAVRVDRRAT
jgi:hypothetical protein